MQQLHQSLDKDHPAFQRAMKHSKTGAIGHIGTHFDCYTSEPEQSRYEVDAIIVNCTKAMPDVGACERLPKLNGQALVLYTDNLEMNEYATEAYFQKETFLTQEALLAILAKSPAFIILDSHGIGTSGKVHTAMDVLCEEHGCHVIENAQLAYLKGKNKTRITIIVDLNNGSTGKPCQLYCED
ncbi:MAG: hypothetical protein Q4E62_00550 [Sutterellaceae bacterium]|nr:hypothetical protein [Sutterellaceae bacterium]